MPKPYDAAAKDLITRYPADWAAAFGLRTDGPVEVLSPDLSAVTAAADVLIRAGDEVLHVDAESGPDPDLPRRILLYNVLAHHRTGLPVRSAVVLLRPNADRRDLDGRYEYAGLTFRFDVLRLWQRPAEELLSGGLGMLPLAVLGRPPEGRTRREAIPELVRGVGVRAERELAATAAETMFETAIIFAEMYMSKQEVMDYLHRIDPNRETKLCQVMFEEGEEHGVLRKAREMILMLGTVKFGPPTDAQKQKLESIRVEDRLDRLGLRLLKVDSWDALLRGR